MHPGTRRWLSDLAKLHQGVVFFFKQKTAYESHNSDWSSDVCSSDLTFLQAIFHSLYSYHLILSCFANYCYTYVHMYVYMLVATYTHMQADMNLYYIDKCICIYVDMDTGLAATLRLRYEIWRLLITANPHVKNIRKLYAIMSYISFTVNSPQMLVEFRTNFFFFFFFFLKTSTNSKSQQYPLKMTNDQFFANQHLTLFI